MTFPIFVSDIHLENAIHPAATLETVKKAFLHFTRLPEEAKDQNLILAGDISSIPHHRKQLLTYLSQAYKSVAYVAGNHEHWGSYVGEWDFEAKSYEKAFRNVVVSENGKVKIWKPDGEENPFLLATLWTSYGYGDPFAEHYLQVRPDISQIKSSSCKTFYDLHMQEKEQILYFLKEFKDKNVTLVTHHIPARCIRPHRIPPSTMDLIFSSKSNEDILHVENPPKTWIFGHTHDKWDTSYNGVAIKANPIGYIFEQKRKLIDHRTDTLTFL